jgi:hypothetical protein
MLLQSITVLAQPMPGEAYMNQTKYWFYRNRLINEFCKVGPNQGESIPFQSIYYAPDPHSPNVTTAQTGDGGLQKLGDYISVLASEIKLLHGSYQDPSNTIKELFYALNAANRLDRTAETYDYCYDLSNLNNNIDPKVKPNHPYPPYTTCKKESGNLNGWLIRDDKDISDTSKFFKYFNNMGGIQNMTSDFGSTVYPYSTSTIGKKLAPTINASTLNDVSHDQLVQLLTGLRLTLLLLNGSEYYTYAGTTYKLTDMAYAIADRVLNYMSSGSSVFNEANCDYVDNLTTLPSGNTAAYKAFWAGPLCSPASALANPQTNNFAWLFQNPVLQQPSSIENRVGASFPFLISKGYAELGNKITSKSYFSTQVAKTAWTALFTQFSDIIYTQNDSWKILTIAALSDSWTPNYIPCGLMQISCPVWVCPLFIPTKKNGKCWGGILKVPSPTETYVCASFNIPCISKSKIIYKQCWNAKFEILPLMYNIINNHAAFDDYDGPYNDFFNYSIKYAPCRGPYCNSATDKAGYGWASWGMFQTANQDNNGTAPLRYNGAQDPGNGSLNSDWGEYNGLDYMLMYNLYNINKGTTNGTYGYYNNYDNNLTINSRVVTGPEYYTARSFTDNSGYTGNKGAVYNGVITSTNVIVNTGAYLNLRAGSSITLSPPFIVNGTMDASIHSAVNNLDWEMSICSDGVPASGVSPSGHREANTNQQNYFSMSDYVANKPDTQIESIDNLGDSYPNPTGSITKIPYTISMEESASIVLTDAKGATVATILKKDSHPIGTFTIEYNTSNLSPGIYYYTLKTPSSSQTKKLVVIN